MVQVIQFVGVIFGVFALLHVYLSYKKNVIKTYGFLFWSLVWLSTIAVALYPNMLQIIASAFEIQRSIDALIYLSIVVLFYLIFKLYLRFDDLERESTKIVRMIALAEAEKETKKKGKGHA